MSEDSVVQLAVMYARVGQQFAAASSTKDLFGAIVQAALNTVPGVESASVSQLKSGKFETVASTDDLSVRGDELQYAAESGPCVDAIKVETVFRVDDLATESRWPDYAPAAAQKLGLRSMLSHRLFVEDNDVIAGLNMYSTRPSAFGEDAEVMSTVLATHAAVTLSASLAREQAQQLRAALISNREIGIAMGVLMHSHKVTRDQAFDLLRIASQHQNRKLAEVAAEVADTGDLHVQAPPPKSSRRRRRTSTVTGRTVTGKPETKQGG